MYQNILLRIVISVVLGSIIGFESKIRQTDKKKKALKKNNLSNKNLEDLISKEDTRNIGALRTYTIISLFGGLAGLFFREGFSGISYILLIGIISFTLAAYILNVLYKKAFGLTTEIAIIITFIIGFLTTSEIVSFLVVFVVFILLTFFLSKKGEFTKLNKLIKRKELVDIFTFCLISIVILPLLPNRIITLGELILSDNLIYNDYNLAELNLINPFQMWLIVVIISGFNLSGFLMTKFFSPKKSVFLNGFFGGFISSTSTTISFAHYSKKNNNNNLSKSINYAGGALISNAISFIPQGILLLLLNKSFFKETFWFLILMLIIGFSIGFIFLIYNKKKNKKSFKIEYEPFSIKPALKFVSIVIIIKLFIEIFLLINISGLFVFITAFSGLIGMDAATIVVADLAKNGSIISSYILIAYIGANLINFIGKAIFSFFYGSKTFWKYYTIGLIITLIAGLIGLII